MEKEKTVRGNNEVLVIGGGVGGIKAALDIAETGRDCVLIDKAPSIGGLMTLLDRTFPTNNCDLCTLSPHLAEEGRKLHINLLPLTQLADIQGEAGAFKVTLKTAPRFIDPEKCTACGDCYKEFPECVRFSPGLDHRAPTCMRYPRATPFAYSIELEKCRDVDRLVQVCRAGAILPQDRETTRQIEVASIVVATGAALFDPSILAGYGYGFCQNVITGLEYEQILSASGPTSGELRRPSDGKPPQKIAWIQCVGSRSVREGCLPYCSSVCCMYALKEAIVTKERFQNDLETVIFFMDMRTSGKDYELYLKRAKEEFNIRLERSRPHTVMPVPGTDDLSITYLPLGEDVCRQEIFDMVVLSTGFEANPDLVDIAKKTGIELNAHNFVKTKSFSPVNTSVPGIYVCGLPESPKDIPETMVQASAAACMSSRHSESSGDWDEEQDELPPERDVTQEEPKIGVFVCDCGNNIGGVIDVSKLVQYACSLPRVVVSKVVGRGCSSESLADIQRTVIEKGLNRVVMAACSPRTHEPLFREILRKAGLNKYLLEIANIRDQDTWVHFNSPDGALNKAKDLVRMAVSGVALVHPLAENTLPMNKNILVVGGGVAGMNAALVLADEGFRVYLVERSPALGGIAGEVRKTLEGEDVQTYMNDLTGRTMKHENIQVMTRSVIVDHSGMPGLFKTGVQVGPQMTYRQITHGVTIIATGALPNRPQEYLLDEHGAVHTQLDLERIIEERREEIKEWEKVVMIQCVGSRCPENPNCSRICCQSAIKNSLRLLDVNPKIQVHILYRQMRTYGFQEEYYREARERGVLFFVHEEQQKPVLEPVEDKLSVTFRDHVLGRDVEVLADTVILSTGFIPDEEGAEDLARIFRLPRTPDGYFLEDHVKLRPVDLPVPGFFVAGAAHSPKNIRESIAQAQAAAARAQTMLAREVINLGATVAKVDSQRCAACLICVRACPFEVPFINADGFSEIDPAKCQGCGVCVAECPPKAIQLIQYEDDYIMAKLNSLLEGVI